MDFCTWITPQINQIDVIISVVVITEDPMIFYRKMLQNPLSLFEGITYRHEWSGYISSEDPHQLYFYTHSPFNDRALKSGLCNLMSNLSDENEISYFISRPLK